MKNIYPVRYLGNLVDIKGGKRLPKGEKYAESPTIHPYLRVCDFISRTIDEANLRFLTKETHSKISRYTISSDDVYISIAGTIGLAGTVPKHLSGANLTENAAKLVIKDKREIDKSYLVHYLNTLGQHEIKKQIKATSQPKLALFRIEKLQIPLPPLEEQRRIAAILDKADAVRRKREEAIQLTEELLLSLFLDMFGDPVTNLKNWEVDKIKNFGEVITGNTPPRSKPENYGNSIEWIKSDNINTPMHFLTKAEEGLSYEGKKIGRVVPPGSVLVICIAGSRSSIGRVALTDREVAFNQQINAIVPNSNVDPYFLYSHFFIAQHLVQAQSTESMKGLVSKSKFSNIQFIKPTEEKQRQFGKLFIKFHDWFRSLHQSAEFSNNLFNSLLQRAFRGEL